MVRNDAPTADNPVADFLEGIRRASNLFPSPIVCDDNEDGVATDNEEDNMIEAKEAANDNVLEEKEIIPEEPKKAVPDDFSRGIRHGIQHAFNLFLILQEIKSHGEDSYDTAALTDNPEPPIIQEEIVDEENDVEADVIRAEEAAKNNVLEDGEAVSEEPEEACPLAEDTAPAVGFKQAYRHNPRPNRTRNQPYRLGEPMDNPDSLENCDAPLHETPPLSDDPALAPPPPQPPPQERL